MHATWSKIAPKSNQGLKLSKKNNSNCLGKLGFGLRLGGSIAQKQWPHAAWHAYYMLQSCSALSRVVFFFAPLPFEQWPACWAGEMTRISTSTWQSLTGIRCKLLKTWKPTSSLVALSLFFPPTKKNVLANLRSVKSYAASHDWCFCIVFAAEIQSKRWYTAVKRRTKRERVE